MIRPLALGLCLAAAAQPVLAQSFLETLSRQAAERAATAAANRIMNAAAGAASRATAPASGSAAPASQDPQAGQVLTPKRRVAAAPSPAPLAEPAPAAAAAAGPAPWPINANDRDLKRPGDLEFSEETKALETAFDEFGMVRCTGCEGGRSYDSWAQHSIKLEPGYGAWDKKLGSLALGETLSWQGVESAGRITVVSETPVGPFRCKQLKWELTKQQARAERPGLVCWGYSSPFSGSESWVEVF